MPSGFGVEMTDAWKRAGEAGCSAKVAQGRARPEASALLSQQAWLLLRAVIGGIVHSCGTLLLPPLLQVGSTAQRRAVA